MKILLRSVLLILILALMLPVGTVSAIPPIAQNFYGTVTLDGAPADGVSVTAEMNGRTAGSTTASSGSYSLKINTIEGDNAGDTISFFVDGNSAGSTSLEPGALTERNLSANSPAEQYTLTININGGGSASGAGTYTEGTIKNISANPDHGWEFVNWTGDTGTIDNVNSASTTITMNGDYTITANFNALDPVTLTLDDDGHGYASANPSAPYYEGDTVSITAHPDNGYKFDRWSGDTGTIADIHDRTTTITMNGNYTVKANFVEAEIYTLTMAVNGNGSTDPPAGEYQYEEDEVVAITAIPDEGWEFINWAGGVADQDSASTSVTMSSDKTITANFAEIGVTTYNLTINVNGNGSTDPAAGSYPYPEGSVVDITATPDEGWQFDGWTGDVASPASASTTITIDADKIITANFSQLPVYTLTINVNGNGSATPTAGEYTYPEGTLVDITAVPDEGWEFAGWTGEVADPNAASTTVTIDGDKTITANFTEVVIIVYTLTIKINGSGSSTPPIGTHQHNEGDVVSITATADEGWQFDGWTGDVASPASASTSVTMSSDKTITANFSDAAPPVVSEVSASGASRTAIDITWTTDEPGDSQVDYYASPGQLSPLDSTLVTQHSVRLTELTPATTYYYKVMSRDASGNLTVSEEYSFATAATEATFATANWDTSLESIEEGTKLSISFSVVNNGDLPGTYTASLTVNGNIADSKEVTLEAGASQQISLATTQSAVGDYTVSINGFAISFEIAEDGGSGVSTSVIIFIFIGLLLLIAAIVFYLKRDQVKEKFNRRQAFAAIPDSFLRPEERQQIRETSTITEERTPPPVKTEEIETEEETEEKVEEDKDKDKYEDEDESGGLTITALAMLKLREALQSKTLDPDMGFRIIPSPSKPSQLKMILDKMKEGDKMVESEGVKILFISPELIPMLEEMVIDYQETPQGGGFTISRLSTDKG